MGRNAADVNIILGGLFLFWGIMGAFYMTQLHVPPAPCATSAVQVGGTCYRTSYLFTLPVFVGLTMLLLGTFTREPVAEAEDLLRTDPFTWMVLGIFFSVFLAMGAMAFYLSLDLVINRVAPGQWVTQVATVPRLAMSTFIAVIAGLVFLVGFCINAAHVRRRRRFHAGFQRAVAKYRGGET